MLQLAFVVARPSLQVRGSVWMVGPPASSPNTQRAIMSSGTKHIAYEFPLEHRKLAFMSVGVGLGVLCIVGIELDARPAG